MKVKKEGKVAKKVKLNDIRKNKSNLRFTGLRLKSGAGDRARTGDNLLGRQGLYQLSYSRLLSTIFLYLWSG